MSVAVYWINLDLVFGDARSRSARVEGVRNLNKTLTKRGREEQSTIAGPSCPRFDSQHSSNFSMGKIANVPEVNQWGCFKESRQWLENVD